LAKRETESVVIDASVFADHHILYPKKAERHRRARLILVLFKCPRISWRHLATFLTC